MKVIACMLVLVVATVNCNPGSILSQNNGNFSLDPRENKALVVIGGDVYFIGTSPKLSWLDSLRMCTSLGMTLASMEHQDKYQLVYDFILNNPDYEDGFYWTSGIRTMENAFIWTNLARELTFTAWAPFEPTVGGTGDVCVFLTIGTPFDIYPDGFHDGPCSRLDSNLICQVSA